MKAAHSLFSFACTHLIREVAEGLRGGEGCGGVRGGKENVRETGNDKLTGEMTRGMFG